MKINNEIENTLPSPKDFFISIPIYKEFSLSSCNSTEYKHIQFFKETIDSYCHKCGDHSIFSVKESQLLRRTLNQHVFLVNFECTRNTEHDLLYIFRISDNKIQKIGQFPSIAENQGNGAIAK